MEPHLFCQLLLNNCVTAFKFGKFYLLLLHFFSNNVAYMFFKINKLHKCLVWSEPTIGEGGAI